jgi:putative nucleotidyltransferase with HDIG domain
MNLTLEAITEDRKLDDFIGKADEQMCAAGYTKHGKRHATWVAKNAGKVLHSLGHEPRTVELARIAGYLHDIGNLINRDSHAPTGALLAQQILEEKGMKASDISDVMMAIGNHHEEDGFPGTPITAALILADKADVHRARVRHEGTIQQDIHDRVNYAAISSDIEVNPEENLVIYRIEIDTNVAPVFEYFQIFLSRMLMAQKAAHTLGCKFHLFINGTKMI